MTRQETSIFEPREPKGLDDPTAIAMHHVKVARAMCERGQYVRAAAHGSIATATALIAWLLGDPAMTPTIPCTPSAEQRTVELHDDPRTAVAQQAQRQRSGVPPIEAETQEDVWKQLRR